MTGVSSTNGSVSSVPTAPFEPRGSVAHARPAGTDLDRALSLAEPLAHVDQVVDARGLDHVEAGQLLGGLGIGAFGDALLAVDRGAQHPRLAARRQLGATGHLVSTLGEPL